MSSVAMHYDHLECVQEGQLVILRLAHPEDGNALTTQLLEELVRALEMYQQANVVLFEALGSNFSIGRPAASYREPVTSLERAYHLVLLCNDLIAHFTGITIAAVQGRAIGAGCSLACRADLVLAGESARFSFPELWKGVPPVIVAAYYAKRMPWHAFLDMVLTGREVTADEGVRLGLVTRVVPDHVLHDTALALARKLATLRPEVVKQFKQFLLESELLSIRHANRLALPVLLESLAQRQVVTDGGGL